MRRMYSKAQIEKIVEEKIAEMPAKIYLHRVTISYQDNSATLVIYNTTPNPFNNNNIIRYLINGVPCMVPSEFLKIKVACIYSYTPATGILIAHYMDPGYVQVEFNIPESSITDTVLEV